MLIPVLSTKLWKRIVNPGIKYEVMEKEKRCMYVPMCTCRQRSQIRTYHGRGTYVHMVSCNAFIHNRNAHVNEQSRCKDVYAELCDAVTT